jgi:membrane-associated phospholipid phosphatase
LSLAVASALAILALLMQPRHAGLLLSVFAGLAASSFGLARLAERCRAAHRQAAEWLRGGLLVVQVPVVYLLLQPLIEITVPWRADAALAAWDAQCCAGLVHAWQNALGRPAALTDAVYLAYGSYYLLPLLVAAQAWRRGAETFERSAFALLLGFYLSYLGYFLWPASGPRVPQADENLILGGGSISEAVRAFLRHAEWTTLDAFPSGHTAVSLIACTIGSRLMSRAATAGLWLWGAAIVFATVYIHVHYVVDLLAGLVLALGVLALAEWPPWFSHATATGRPASPR